MFQFLLFLSLLPFQVLHCLLIYNDVFLHLSFLPSPLCIFTYIYISIPPIFLTYSYHLAFPFSFSSSPLFFLLISHLILFCSCLSQEVVLSPVQKDQGLDRYILILGGCASCLYIRWNRISVYLLSLSIFDSLFTKYYHKTNLINFNVNGL